METTILADVYRAGIANSAAGESVLARSWGRSYANSEHDLLSWLGKEILANHIPVGMSAIFFDEDAGRYIPSIQIQFRNPETEKVETSEFVSLMDTSSRPVGIRHDVRASLCWNIADPVFATADLRDSMAVITELQTALAQFTNHVIEHLNKGEPVETIAAQPCIEQRIAALENAWPRFLFAYQRGCLQGVPPPPKARLGRLDDWLAQEPQVSPPDPASLDLS